MFARKKKLKHRELRNKDLLAKFGSRVREVLIYIYIYVYLPKSLSHFARAKTEQKSLRVPPFGILKKIFSPFSDTIHPYI